VSVKVVNSVWNGSLFIQPKKARRLVAEGRAVFLGEDQQQLRLIESHDQNLAAKSAAEDSFIEAMRNAPRQAFDAHVFREKIRAVMPAPHIARPRPGKAPYPRNVTEGRRTAASVTVDWRPIPSRDVRKMREKLEENRFGGR
jgi:hypothetical protein